jgi:hypothetical protein
MSKKTKQAATTAKRWWAGLYGVLVRVALIGPRLLRELLWRFWERRQYI